MRSKLYLLLTVFALCGMWWHPLSAGDEALRKAARLTGARGESWESNGVTFRHSEDNPRGYWRSDGPYETVIKIDRYYGTRRQIRRQMEKGLIPATAKLMIFSYDCDRYTYPFQGAPELDRIFFNGHYAGLVSGYDMAESVTYVEIPLEWINFPSRPGEIAENRLRIDIDTGNTEEVWELYQSAQELYLPAPLPVYIVHGWTKDISSVRALQETLDAEYGIPSELANVEMELTPHANASLMRDELKKLTAAYGVPRFNIIAHSKGGLDSRMLVDPYMPHNGIGMVNAIMQVGTPNGGSRLADMVMQQDNDLEDLLYMGAFITGRSKSPGVFSLRPSVCELFNRRCSSPAVPIYTIAGSLRNYVPGDGHPDCPEDGDEEDFWPGYFLARLSYLHDFYSGDPRSQGDGIVSVASAHCIGTALPESPLLDNGRRNTEHSALLTDSASAVLQNFESVLTALPDPSGSVFHEISAAEHPAVFTRRRNAVPDRPWQLSANMGTYSAQLPPGGTVAMQIAVPEDGEVLVSLSGVPSGGCATLTAPDGSKREFIGIGGGEAWNDVLKVADLRNGSAGRYTLQVTDVPGGSGGNLLAAVAGGKEFSIELLDCGIDGEEGKVAVSALVLLDGEYVNGDNITVNCHWRMKENGAWQQVSLLPDEYGGGWYSGEFTAVGEGLCQCVISAEMRGQAGEMPIVRSYYFTVPCSSGNAIIDAAAANFTMQDENGDGMNEKLLVAVPVTVSTAGHYCLRGEIVTDEYTPAGRSAAWFEADAAGKYCAVMEFSGAQLHRAAGEYLVLTGLSLQKEVDGEVVEVAVDNTESHYAADAFEFQHEAVKVAGVQGECLVADTEYGGGYGGIIIEVAVEATPAAAGFYSVAAPLLAKDGRICAEAVEAGVYIAGNGTPENITMFFDGMELQASGIDGPYRLGGICLYDGNRGRKYLLDCDSNTAEYAARDFSAVAELIATVIPCDGEISAGGMLPGGEKILEVSVPVECPEDVAGLCAPFVLQLQATVPDESANWQMVDADYCAGGKVFGCEVTAGALEALQNTGNGNEILEAGERITLTMRCRCPPGETSAIPPEIIVIAGRIHGFHRELTSSAAGINHEYDTDCNRILDADEVDSGWRRWLDGTSMDNTLLEAVEILRSGGPYVCNPSTGAFQVE